jgi:hypothetical protein
MDLYKKKYLKYKNKYELIKNQTGGNYLLTLTENDKCPICLVKLIDTCSACNQNGKNFCPNPSICVGTTTNPEYCSIFLSDCGHLFHSHCIAKITENPDGTQVCPNCRKKFNMFLTRLPQYQWSSGFIEPKTESLIKIREDESGGKWKQIFLINLIELIKAKKPIVSYIYGDGSQISVRSEILKLYEDSIKKK